MDDGGPAFPVETSEGGSGAQTGPMSGWHTGMSLRDWFAGRALTGMLANPAIGHMGDWEAVALDAYNAADAMLAARKSKS